MNPIHDYAAIGDCRTAALVSRAGSIDWLCWPRFDSPSIFGAILDDAAGTWRIAPVAPYVAERHYIDGTNVLQTRFTTEHGSVVLTDLMPVHPRADVGRWLVPEHELQRVVTCEAGSVELELELAPNFTYTAGEPRFYDSLDDGYVFGKLEAASLSATLSATYTFLPTLTLQVYGQGFASFGRYSDFSSYAYTSSPKPLILLSDLSQGADVPAAEESDFVDSTFNANVVVRWEYRLGSTVYGQEKLRCHNARMCFTSPKMPDFITSEAWAYNML